MIDHIRAQFQSHFGSTRDLSVVMAPGRVNLIGEYTDFNDGFVLPMTVDRGVYIGIRPRSDNHVSIISPNLRDRDLRPWTFEQPKPGHWSCYVLGVVEELRLLGLILRVRGGHRWQSKSRCGLEFLCRCGDSTAWHCRRFSNLRCRVLISRLSANVSSTVMRVMCGIMDQFC